MRRSARPPRWRRRRARTRSWSLGGGEIYAAAIGRADRLYITHVAAEPAGTVALSAIDPALWHVVSREGVPAGEKDSAATVFTVYERAAGAETG